jgi:glutathione S-transferase
MSLVFHGHPLSSYCWKALIALYENETPFAFELVNLGDPAARAAFAAIWPIAKMPVLVDQARGETVAETSIIIDYLDRHYPGATRFVPEDPEAARQARFWDRVCDNYLQAPMQRIVLDRLRPADKRDPLGVEEARGLLATALAHVESHLPGRTWLAGGGLGLADCAAAPALFYADKVSPFAGSYPVCALYLERLKARPSFARVLVEAEPYFQYFPSE